MPLGLDCAFLVSPSPGPSAASRGLVQSLRGALAPSHPSITAHTVPRKEGSRFLPGPPHTILSPWPSPHQPTLRSLRGSLTCHPDAAGQRPTEEGATCHDREPGTQWSGNLAKASSDPADCPRQGASSFTCQFHIYSLPYATPGSPQLPLAFFCLGPPSQHQTPTHPLQ